MHKGTKSVARPFIVSSVIWILVTIALFSHVLRWTPTDIALHDLPSDRILQERVTAISPEIYAFVLRDALRSVNTQTLIPDLHVFDFVNVHTGTMATAKSFTLFVDGYPKAPAPCIKYSVSCYNEKIVQAFEFALELAPPSVRYFYYTEADNDVCQPIAWLAQLAAKEKRYFIGTGIGASGWIMSRAFVHDFLRAIRQFPDKKKMGPDVIASRMLMEQQSWSVTRQYWTSHTNVLLDDGLSVKKQKVKKHLPRCGEPHRALWPTPDNPTADLFGWDYFDFDACPTADIFPCNVTSNATVWTRNHPLDPFNETAANATEVSGSNL